MAFSDDGGISFDPPARVDDGAPVGRVDLLTLEDGAVLVSWIERTGSGAEVRVRRVAPDRSTGDVITISGTSAERAGGFPRMVRTPDGILLAWTQPGDSATVRIARLRLPD